MYCIIDSISPVIWISSRSFYFEICAFFFNTCNRIFCLWIFSCLYIRWATDHESHRWVPIAYVHYVRWVPRNSETPILTYCVLVAPYGDRDQGQHLLMQWLVAWRHQAITWTNVDLSTIRTRDIHLKVINVSYKSPMGPTSWGKLNVASTYNFKTYSIR